MSEESKVRFKPIYCGAVIDKSVIISEDRARANTAKDVTSLYEERKWREQKE